MSSFDYAFRDVREYMCTVIFWYLRMKPTLVMNFKNFKDFKMQISGWNPTTQNNNQGLGFFLSGGGGDGHDVTKNRTTRWGVVNKMRCCKQDDVLTKQDEVLTKVYLLMSSRSLFFAFKISTISLAFSCAWSLPPIRVRVRVRVRIRVRVRDHHLHAQHALPGLQPICPLRPYLRPVFFSR